MSEYLKVVYKQDEFNENQYPQKFCTYISNNYFKNVNGAGQRSLLDIGSGKGHHIVGFSRNNFEVKGLDKRKECIESLKEADIRECDLENSPFPYEDNSFDCVFSKSVLEHVYNTENIVRETYRVLKPGGISVQLTPDWRTDFRFFWDDPTHVKPFTRKGLQDAFKFENFVDVDCTEFYQLPFLWKYKFLSFFRVFLALLPDSLKWKDDEELIQRPLIRHAKERMLIVVAKKPL